MSTRRLPGTIALAVWSLLVWTTRIRNIWTDEALTTGERWARTALAGSFTVLAVAVVVALVQRASWLRPAVGVLAVWSVVVWVVRSVGIATADHDAGFVAVHLVLAVVSAVLSGLAWRQVAAGADRARVAG